MSAPMSSPVSTTQPSREGLPETIWQHMQTFSSLGSRAVGYPGHDEAGRHIESVLRNLGLKDLQADDVILAAPIDEGASLKIAELTVPLACFWPNLVRTPVTPPEGLEGKLFYGRKGYPEDFRGIDLSQCIVILDFDCGDHYILARSLGARAILFIEPDTADRSHAVSKVMDSPVSIPRYWLSKQAWQAIQPAVEQGSSARVHAKMTWKRVTARNIFARLPGRDPKFANEPIVLMSSYDASSVVPAIAPGADQACSISTLLWLAKHFSRNPSLRPIWFVALDAHALSNGGMDDFLVRHCMSGRTYDDWASNFVKRSPPERGLQINPVLMLDLSLASGSRTLGSFWDGSDLASNDFHRNSIIKVGDVFVQQAGDLLKAGDYQDVQFVSGIRPLQGITWHSYLPIRIQFDSTIALKAKQHAMALATALDSRPAWDTPLDTLDRVNRENLFAQAALVTDLLDKVLSNVDLVRRNISANDFRAYKWPIIPFLCKANKSKLADRPVTTEPMEDALVVLRAEGRIPWLTGGYTTEIGLSDKTGYHVDLLSDHKRLSIYGYKLDPVDGSIIYVADRGEEGAGRQSLDLDDESNGILVMFRCATMDLYDLADPVRFKTLDQFGIMLPTGGTPQKFGYCWLPRGDARLCLTVHVPRNMRIRFAAGRGMFGFQYLLLNATQDEPEGEGLLLTDETPVFQGNFKALQDIVTLNEARFNRLNKRGIKNELVQDLLTRAHSAQDQAAKALDARDWDTFLRSTYEGLGYATTAYPQVKGMARDTVEGVVFYFALLIPFAFFLERLLFGFPDIRKQLVAVGVIFLIVFGIMGVIHPAFQISDSPYVIFLAFIIMALAAIVMSIVIGKFGEQMQEMRASGGEAHRVDVGRVSASMAAVVLGISNLRKRRVRTILTTGTIVLLTFAVLSFTVVSSSTRYYRIPRPYKSSYQGILFRDRNWIGISHVLQDYIQYAFAREVGRGNPQAVIAPRCWYFMEKDNDLSLPIGGPAGQWARVAGAVGVVPEETRITHLDECLVQGRWIADRSADEVMLPAPLAKTLGVDLALPGLNTIEAFGRSWKVVGILDGSRFSQFKDLDGEPISPTQPRKGKDTAMVGTDAASEARLEAESQRSTDVQAVNHIDPQTIPVFAYDRLARYGGRLQGIAVGGIDVESQASKKQLEDLLARTNLLAFVGYPDKAVRAISATGQTGVGWASGLLVPVIIASLIVLNTMLGSVYERRREISTYSSVGLAPSHIAALFLAESSVFAVVGAFTGYLLGQGVAKLLLTTGLLGGININYSSTAAVLTSVIVMGVVMLSAVYPSKVAARMAVPDVTRRWTFPSPAGDIWRFEFPFTVADWQVLGLFAFLTDFFSACAEESVGVFYTRNTKLEREAVNGQPRHRISLDVWLAPYDLGVSQHVQLLAEPTEDSRIHRIEMTIIRRSGEHAAWQQRNRAFLAELRRQFLIYRTIPEAAKQRWEQQARDHLDAVPAAAGASL